MRALILAGGAARNSYQLGCLQYLLGNLQIQYDLIIGVSSGAILGSFLGQYKSGQEKQSIDDLSILWKGIKTKDICKPWRPLGRIHALWKHGLYDNSNIFALVRNNIKLEKIRSSDKTVCVSVVEMSDGLHHTINQDDENFLTYVVASAAFPGVFPAVQINDRFYIDGGTKDLVNTQYAIDRGCSQIDILLTTPNKIEKEAFSPSILNIIRRIVDIQSDKIMTSDLDRILNYNEMPGRDKILLNIIRPNDTLLANSFKWEADKMEELIFMGYSDAIQQYHNHE
jgi:NTE family protein